MRLKEKGDEFSCDSAEFVRLCAHSDKKSNWLSKALRFDGSAVTIRIVTVGETECTVVKGEECYPWDSL